MGIIHKCPKIPQRFNPLFGYRAKVRTGRFGLGQTWFSQIDHIQMQQRNPTENLDQSVIEFKACRRNSPIVPSFRWNRNSDSFWPMSMVRIARRGPFNRESLLVWFFPMSGLSAMAGLVFPKRQAFSGEGLSPAKSNRFLLPASLRIPGVPHWSDTR